jgi:hypothetical protein
MIRIRRSRAFGFLSFALVTVLAASHSYAQSRQLSPVAPRVTGPVDDSQRTVLHGNVHPLAQPRFDRGAVEDAFPAQRLLLLLKRSDAQESALRDFIQAAHTPGDPSFHQWLKPDEFGRLYGPADSDIASVTAWLQSHGFTINQVHPGHMAIEFSGTAGQLRDAFHTEIHRYEIRGEAHLANAKDPEIPAALAPVIEGLAPMNDFRPKPSVEVLGRANFNPKTHQAQPAWTYPDGGGYFNVALAPGDFATQYDINSVYSSGINGTGQSIAIVSASNVDLSLVQAYRNLFGLSANLPEVVVDGNDPGENDAAIEAYLDVEVSGSVAPGARIILYTAADTTLSSGLGLAAYRAIGDDLAGVISTSYENCELNLGPGGNQFFQSLWQQAAAQGQTSFVASSDSGSAGCDNFDTQTQAALGLQVNGISSTPYNVSVGGTDFYYSDYGASSSTLLSQVESYWSGITTGGTPSPKVSLLKRIPEQVWNNFFGYNWDDGGKPANLSSETIVAGSGGRSSSAVFNGSSFVGYPKPTWQAGTGVPADKVRDLPDLSLYASNDANYSFYPICAEPGDCSSTNLNSGGAELISGVGGTSASTPAMAAIQTLVNQSTGSWQGQANFVYYPLAAKEPSVFHDVTVGGNEVPCVEASPNCVAGKTGTITAGYYVENGYPSTVGYDLATGLGSLDVANLIKYWDTVVPRPTTTTLSLNPTTFVHGKLTTITSTVAPKTGTGEPTGTLSIGTNDAISHYTGVDYLTLSSGGVDYPVDNLPGGTYQVTATYSGDGIFAASKSTPVTITVTPESDTLLASSYAISPYDGSEYALPPGSVLPYGAQVILDVTPVSSNATESNFGQPATGSILFTDTLAKTATTATAAISTDGAAEWSSGIFAPGSHTVSASYAGDPSYKASTLAKAAAFTIVPGSTSLHLYPPVAWAEGNLTSVVTAGTNVTISVELNTGDLPLYGKLPTGNVTVTLGGKSITTTLLPRGDTGDAYLSALVTFPNVPAGLLQLSGSYAGDSNWLGSQVTGRTVLALSNLLGPTVALTSTLADPLPGQPFTLTAAVHGPSGKPVPTGSIDFIRFVTATEFESYRRTLTVGATSSTATLTLDGWQVANGNDTFTAVYSGDANYNAGTSNGVDEKVVQSDFSLTTLNQEVSIAAGKSGTSSLVLAPSNGFTSPVGLSASAPGGITVKYAVPSPTVSATVNDVATISVSSSVKPSSYPLVITGSGGGHMHNTLILVTVP